VGDATCTSKDCRNHAAPGRKRCDRCNGRQRAQYTARVDGGRCARCSAPPVPGRAMCQTHLDAARAYEQARRAEAAR